MSNICATTPPHYITSEEFEVMLDRVVDRTVRRLFFDPAVMIHQTNMFQQMKINAIQEAISFINTLGYKLDLFVKIDEFYRHVFDNFVDMKDGLNLEFGVFSGRTINIFSSFLSGEEFYGFDSFEGFEEVWLGSGRRFKREKLPKVNENVCLIKGYYENTLDNFLSSHKDVCKFIHMDSDIYSSTKYVLKRLCEECRIVTGTLIIFDEFYCIPNWKEHEFKAWTEVVYEFGLNYKYVAGTYSNQIAVKII